MEPSQTQTNKIQFFSLNGKEAVKQSDEHFSEQPDTDASQEAENAWNDVKLQELQAIEDALQNNNS